MDNIILELEDKTTKLEETIKKMDHIINYSIIIPELENEKEIKKDLWKFPLIAKELYINIQITNDYLNELKQISKDLNNIVSFGNSFGNKNNTQ